MLSSNRFSLLALSVLVTLVLASCGESVKSQCTRFGSTVNDYSQKVKNNPPKNWKDLAQVASNLDTYAKDLGSMKFQDSRLKEFQGRFVAMYQETSKASRTLVEASQKQDSKAGVTALTALQKAVSQEAPLLQDVNQYCQKQ